MALLAGGDANAITAAVSGVGSNFLFQCLEGVRTRLKARIGADGTVSKDDVRAELERTLTARLSSDGYADEALRRELAALRSEGTDGHFSGWTVMRVVDRAGSQTAPSRGRLAVAADPPIG
jgi:hypothetical protein